MRVAVCGTHGVGKSTLIEAFLERRNDYAFEPEAYEALTELYGEGFAAEPSAEDYVRQLEFNVARLKDFAPGDRVIFERCPADYVAYLLALDALSRPTADTGLTENAIQTAREAMGMLDLIIFLPAQDGGPASEDPELRHAVDAILEAILIGGERSLLREDGPIVLEATGPTSRRLRILEGALR